MPAGDQIASLFVTVSADTSRFNSGLRGVQSNVRNAGRDLMNLASTAAAALGGAAILSTVSNFESKMAELRARTGLGADEMERMRNVALDMGSSTVFSATTAADALLELVAGGLSAEDAISSLDSVLNLAASSGIDLGKAADSITDILSMFDLDVSAATEVSDALTAIAGLSSADVSDVIEAFNNVGPIAKTFGMDVKQLAAAIGILSDQGTKGAEAGTAIKSMLIAMSSQTTETRNAWDKLGTSLYDLEGNIRPMDDVLADIKTGLADMTDEEQNQTIQALAGSFGQVALRALLSSVGIGATVEQMSKAATAANIAQQRTETFQGKLDLLKSAAETLLIEALTPLLNKGLTPLVASLTDTVRNVGEWLSANPELTSTIVTVGAAVIGLSIAGGALNIILSGLATIVAVGGALVTGITAVGGALLTLLGPIGLVAVAVGGLIALLAALSTTEAAAANSLRNFDAEFSDPAYLRMLNEGQPYQGAPQTVTNPMAFTPNPEMSIVNPFPAVIPPGRASGGPVSAGQIYRVGEQGAEWFVPGMSGRIIPNGGGSGNGGGDVVIPVTLTLDGKTVFEAVIREDKRRNGRGW